MEKVTKTPPARNVDEYLAALPSAVQTMLEKLRQTIREAAPKAEEVISYRVPTYKYKGPLIHFAAFKNHCSLMGVSKNLVNIFTEELQGYTVSGTTIHFTPDKPLPTALVQKIVQTRIKQNEERSTVQPVRNKKVKA